MNYANLHLILNHIPVVALPLIALFLLFSIIKKNMQMKYFSLILLIAAGVITAPTYFTGEPAEHATENIANITEDVIHPHEEMAEKAFILTIITALMAVAALALYKNEKYSDRLAKTCLALAVFTSMGLIYTAHLGGMIRHTEVREGLFPNTNN